MDGFSSACGVMTQIEDLKRLCQIGSRTPGHPENVTTEGIEVTTGMVVTTPRFAAWLLKLHWLQLSFMILVQVRWDRE
jgi:hypothetical protein